MSKQDFIHDPRLDFFEELAVQWDAMQNLERQQLRLHDLLEELEVEAHEVVADIGCGTGTLSLILAQKLSDKGRILAVDFSSAMLERARNKTDDPCITWIWAAAENMDAIANQVCDRIFCYSVWPHFADVTSVLQEFQRILKPGGKLHVVHLISRDQVNHIHHTARNPAVHHDTLLPVAVVAAAIAQAGFVVVKAHEDEVSFRIDAHKEVSA